MIVVNHKNELRDIILEKKIPLDEVDVSKLTDLSYIFKNIDSVLGCFSYWDVSNCENMSFLFEFSKVNCDINYWNVSNVKYMKGIFRFSKINSALDLWDIRNVVDFNYKYDFYESNIKIPVKWKILQLFNDKS